MADLSEVIQAFVTLIGATVYPNGESQASIVDPSPVVVFGGWPIPGSLDAGLLATPSVVNVSIYNLPGDRDVTRFFRTVDRPTIPNPGPTITASVSGATVTLGGTITPGNYVTVVAGNQAASYGIRATDTLWSVAQALAIQFTAPVMAAAYPTTTPTISLTGGGVTTVAARVASPQPQLQEIERVQKRFQITVWAASDTLRNVVGKAIRPAIMTTAGLLLPDTTTARVWPVADLIDDTKERANGYMRDMIFMVEYPTLIQIPQYPVTTIETDFYGSLPDGTTIGKPNIRNI